MSLTLTTIGIKDAITTIRTNVNSNFTAVKEILDDLDDVLDLNESELVINDITITKGDRAVSTTILVIEASGTIAGNLTVAGTTTLNVVTLATNKSLTIPTGQLNVTGVGSVTTLEGRTSIDGYIINKDFGNATIDASLSTNYISVVSNIGTLSVENLHAMILDFSNYDSAVDVENLNDIEGITLSQGAYQGQLLTLIVNAAGSAGKPHTISSTNLAITNGDVISINVDNAVIDLIYIGTSWTVRNLTNATIVTP